jgi:hypothetical protein
MKVKAVSVATRSGILLRNDPWRRLEEAKREREFAADNSVLQQLKQKRQDVQSNK